MTDSKSVITLATGEQLEVTYDFDAGDWFEEKSGHALLPAFTAHFGTRTMCWILLAGARKSRPKLTYEQLRNKLNDHLTKGGTLPGLSEQIQKALSKSGLLRGKDEGQGEEETSPLPPVLTDPT